jgi:ribosome maturation factor RimP
MWGRSRIFYYRQVRTIICWSEQTQSLQSHIEPLVVSAGAHLVDLVFRPQGRRRVLEIFVDTEDGITADLLAELSRTIGKAIEESDWITDAYQLVVSSPGLEKPLRFPWQYRRHLGRTVKLTLREGEVARELEGRILEATDEQLVVSQGEGAIPVPHERIEQARIIAVL